MSRNGPFQVQSQVVDPELPNENRRAIDDRVTNSPASKAVDRLVRAMSFRWSRRDSGNHVAESSDR